MRRLIGRLRQWHRRSVPPVGELHSPFLMSWVRRAPRRLPRRTWRSARARPWRSFRTPTVAPGTPVYNFEGSGDAADPQVVYSAGSYYAFTTGNASVLTSPHSGRLPPP